MLHTARCNPPCGFTIFPPRRVTFIIHQIELIYKTEFKPHLSLIKTVNLNISIATLFQNATVSSSGDSFLRTIGTFASLVGFPIDK